MHESQSTNKGSDYYYDYFTNTKSSSLCVGILYGVCHDETETKCSTQTILSSGLQLTGQTLEPGSQNPFLVNSDGCSKILTQGVKPTTLLEFFEFYRFIGNGMKQPSSTINSIVPRRGR